ncbi:MAG: hypothetical protein IJW24_05105 [Clostridia bacterium]|nr:hypothetical protein [Clostridia bacterium]
MRQKEYLSNLIQEIFEEASNGQIFIARNSEFEWRYYSRFYSNIEGSDKTKNKSYPTVRIRNYAEFVDELDEYLDLARDFYEFDKDYHEFQEDHDFDKFLILCLLANADFGDLQDITKFVSKRKKMLENHEELSVVDVGDFGKYFCQAKITKHQAALEAPFCFTPHFYDEERGEEYVLPSVTYGVIDGQVVIYAVQGRREKQTNKVSKDISRFLRKVNSGVDLPLGEDDDPENFFEGMNLRKDIKNVSPFALVSLTMFLSNMKSRGFSQVSAPALLPIRYLAERHAVLVRAKVKGIDDVSPLIQRREDIQKNATDNFMHLFARYCFHFDNSEFDYDDINHRMVLTTKEQKHVNGNILFEIDQRFRNSAEKEK